MRILLSSFRNLDSLVCSIPFLKSLQDMFPQCEITVASCEKYSPIVNIVPYIHNFISADSYSEFFKNEAVLFEYDQIIDLDKLLSGSIDADLARFLKSNVADIVDSRLDHRVDMLLRYIPVAFRRYQFIFQETLSGYDKAKLILNQDYDVVVYPFESNKVSYGVEMFLKYFLSMNPDKKVLVIGFQRHRVELDGFVQGLRSSNKVDTAVVNMETALSILRKTEHFVVANSPLKYFANHKSTTVYDIHASEETQIQSGVYKDQSYCLVLTEQPIRKIVYRSDEFVFDNSAHFLAYFITAVLDNDYEKMVILAEAYENQSKIFKTSIDRSFRWRLVPLFWKNETIKEFLAYNALRYTQFEHNTDIFENVYDHIMEDSEYSYDRIFYETSAYLNHIICIRELMSKSSSFGIFHELQELAQKAEYKPIIRIMANYMNFNIQENISDWTPAEIKNRLPAIRVALKDIQRFLNEFKIYSSQKILESFDSTGDLRI